MPRSKKKYDHRGRPPGSFETKDPVTKQRIQKSRHCISLSDISFEVFKGLGGSKWLEGFCLDLHLAQHKNPAAINAAAVQAVANVTQPLTP